MGRNISGLALVFVFFLILSVPALVAFSAPAGAAEPAKGRDEFEAFGEFSKGDPDPFSSVDISGPAAVPDPLNRFRVGGFFKTEAEYGFEKSDEPLSRLRPLLYLETEARMTDDLKFKASAQGFWEGAYEIEARDKHSDTGLDDDEWGLEIKDLYLDGRVGPGLTFRAGRQIVAFGASDYAGITDVVNPRDLTRPGRIDLEDARLPVAAFRFTAGSGPWSLDAVTVHEHPGFRISGEGADFDYFAALRRPGIRVGAKDLPDFSLDNTGLALRLKYFFNGGDVALIAADTYDDRPVLAYKGIRSGALEFTPEYRRMQTLGASATLARGETLYKAEAAYRLGRDILRTDAVSQVLSGVPQGQVRTVSEKDQVLALAGLEYTGITDLRLNFEAEFRHTLDDEPGLSVEENEVATYFQATKDLLNQTLSLDFFWVTLNPGMGNILRFTAAYDLFDDLALEAGVVFYSADSSKTALYPYQDRDRVFFAVKYSF